MESRMKTQNLAMSIELADNDSGILPSPQFSPKALLSGKGLIKNKNNKRYKTQRKQQNKSKLPPIYRSHSLNRSIRKNQLIKTIEQSSETIANNLSFIRKKSLKNKNCVNDSRICYSGMDTDLQQLMRKEIKLKKLKDKRMEIRDHLQSLNRQLIFQQNRLTEDQKYYKIKQKDVLSGKQLRKISKHNHIYLDSIRSRRQERGEKQLMVTQQTIYQEIKQQSEHNKQKSYTKTKEQKIGSNDQQLGENNDTVGMTTILTTDYNNQFQEHKNDTHHIMIDDATTKQHNDPANIQSLQ